MLSCSSTRQELPLPSVTRPTLLLVLLVTGKTSVIDLAMGRPPAVDRHSTGVAESPSCSIMVGDDSSEDVEWEELTPDRMLDMVCETIEALAEPVDHLGTERHAVLQQHETGATPTLCDPPHSPPGAAGHTPATKHRPRHFPQILTDIMQRLPKVRGSTTPLNDDGIDECV